MALIRHGFVLTALTKIDKAFEIDVGESDHRYQPTTKRQADAAEGSALFAYR